MCTVEMELEQERGEVEPAREQHADLLNCGGEVQTQLNDLILDAGEVTDPSQGRPATREERKD